MTDSPLLIGTLAINLYFRAMTKEKNKKNGLPSAT